MTQQQQIQCRNFQAKLGQFKIDELDKTLKVFISNPGQNNQQLEDVLQVWQETKGGFNEEYQQEARKLLEKWFPLDDTEKSAFMKSVKFDSFGRIVIDKDDTVFENFPITYLPSVIRKFTGNVNIANTRIRSINYLEEVNGNFDTESDTLEQMKRLKKVGKWLNIEGNKLKELAQLEFVGGDFSAEFNEHIVALPKLIKVGGNMTIGLTNIKELPSLKEIGGYFVANFSSLKKAEQLESIGQSLEIRGLKIKDFRKAFPKLNSLGQSDSGVSVYVPYSALGHQIELIPQQELRRSGKIILG